MLGFSVRYAENKTQGVVNGIILYFEDGDEEIAMGVLELAAGSPKPPTSICWNGECMTSWEALVRIWTDGLLGDDWLGVRLTIDDRPLAEEILGLFKDDYPALAPVIDLVESIFATRH